MRRGERQTYDARRVTGLHAANTRGHVKDTPLTDDRRHLASLLSSGCVGPTPT